MNNLSVYEVTSKQLSNKFEDKLLCFGHNDENSSNEVYICTHNLIVSNTDMNCFEKWNKDLSDAASSGNTPINITYLTLPNMLCVGLSNGELFNLSADGTSCDLAGACDNGILAMEWSLDQELFIIVTKTLDVILMSCMFDPINEVNLLKQEFGEKQFITVGWGKKETQFHGSAGKQAAKIQQEINADESIDNSIKITWRSDGQFYAVGYSLEGIRRFKVFDRDGELQYTSEKQKGLESLLVWRPSGNVITTTQRLQNEYVVAFFEKNGLKHGSFVIPVSTTTTVVDISWSSDSEILALHCIDNDIMNAHTVLIFTTSNYHWYLKQVITFKLEQEISKILWSNDFDVANNKKLHIILKSGEWYSYTWITEINHSVGNNNKDDGVVAVIDGKKAMLTGFRQTVVPPPMAAFELESYTNINSIHFAPTNEKSLDSNSFFICTNDNKLVFYEQICKFPLKYERTNMVAIEEAKFPFQYFNWKWVRENIFVCISVQGDNCHVVEYSLESEKLIIKNEITVPFVVTKISAHPTDLNKLYLQMNNGEIVEYTLGGDINPLDVCFPSACKKFDVLSINNNLHFLGLSIKGNFYVDGQLALNGVSSYFLHSHFLLLTTLKHFLLCTELTNEGIHAIGEYKQNESAQVYKRKIERGAKLILSVPCDTRTIFQMPRGNLEAIQPRPLSLKIIGTLLDDLKYYEAFDLMRKQRINLNLIHDHDPNKFFKYIDVFLNRITNNSWLSLFLSDLENVDVTKTMYANSYTNKTVKSVDYDLKIVNICNIVRTKLNEMENKDDKILPILTTYVKKNTIVDLENALYVVKNLKKEELKGFKPPVGSDEALKYLLYMVEVNHLFDVALGMYDFDLVLLVAEKSQKDPKEYIPLLNEFNGMTENYKRFSVNKHLKRFDRAVECLANCGPEKLVELRAFVKYHSLYKNALDLFKPDTEIYRQISDDFGLYLRLKKQFTEAGIIYRRANAVDKAIECFKEALEWELVIELINKLPQEQVRELYRALAKGLQEEKRHDEALKIMEQFCDNREETIAYSIECGHYKTAIRLCNQYDRSDLKENEILPAVLKDYENLCELIENNWSTFLRHKERLQVVRENKAKSTVDVYDPAFLNKDSDLYSDAGSTLASSTSRSSSRTYRSSKNRRKHERKVASLKEGSQYEDVALVIALHGLVTSSFELRLQVKELSIALGCFGKDKEIFIIQKSLEKLLKEMKDCFKDIWTSELVLEAVKADIAARDVPEGCSIIPQGIATLDSHLRIAPVIQDLNWKLDGFN